MPTDRRETNKAQNGTGSDVNDDRRILIEDVDEGDMDVEVDGKERDILDEDDYNEEDGDD